jgi:hypothetical protein
LPSGAISKSAVKFPRGAWRVYTEIPQDDLKNETKFGKKNDSPPLFMNRWQLRGEIGCELWDDWGEIGE